MPHNNPYAQVIRTQQIIFRLGCAEDNKKRIKSERALFADYCKDMTARGIFCKDQREAWDNYNKRFPFDKPSPDFVITNEPKESLTWEAELFRDLAKRAQWGNYSDTGGQL